MIKEPTRLTTVKSWHDLCEANQGSQIFYSVNSGVLTLAEVYPQNFWYPKETPGVRKIWSCCNKGNQDRYRLGEGTVVSKEIFIKYIGDNYPNYMDWFLFNIEWLQ